MLEGKEEEKEDEGGDTLLDEEGRLRDVMIKCMRGRRERGNRVGSTASHWISLMLPAENREKTVINTWSILTHGY